VNSGPFKLFLLNDAGQRLAFFAKVGVLILFLAARSSRAGSRSRGDG